MMRLSIKVALAAWAVLAAPAARAQVVHSANLHGRVLRGLDTTGVAGADIWVITSDIHATSDSAGGFRLTGLPPGLVLVEVRRVGYVVVRDTIHLSDEHENVKTYVLMGGSTQLDTVHTTAASGQFLSHRLQAFEARRLSGQGGFFISDSVFRRNENTTLANLLVSRIPGVTVEKGRTLVSTRKACRGLVFLGHATKNGNSDCRSNPDCYVTIYLDGNVYYTARMADQGVSPPDLSRELPVSDFSGAEFYGGGAAAPAGMHSNDDGCGSLWLWTREK